MSSLGVLSSPEPFSERERAVGVDLVLEAGEEARRAAWVWAVESTREWRTCAAIRARS